MIKLTRAEFFRMFLPLTAFFGLIKVQAGCSADRSDEGVVDGGGDGEPVPQPDCLNAGTNVAIASNHGHTLSISKDDVAAGLSKSYSIQGSAGHNHTVTLAPADFMNLASNLSISVTSSPPEGGGHTHKISVSCKLA
ncbi:MAG: hypothetical protein KDC45_11340 [Bacteroidetes bacterium]|nr:hypothetical protein [Bacteroidota bacterium]